MDKQLKEQFACIDIPKELHTRSQRGIAQAKCEMGGMKRTVKRKLGAALITACLLVPTGALAYQSLLADDIYGSFENIQKHAAVMTMEGYLLFDAKLNEAKGTLGEREYEAFKEQLQLITSAKLTYGDANGNIDYTNVPAHAMIELEAAMHTIQPYFDLLNDVASSKDVLTPNEYTRYIDALMTYETVMAQMGTSSAPVLEDVPTAWQDDFAQAQNYLDYVNNQQIK
ncbi:MAG: DUF3600 domain-containing protein [Caryophanon sp.]|nr:DUF3600 domain-containing protein [Caryophanon sp.]